MNKKQLGRSDLYISELTLGCMSVGTDKKNAQAIIDYALDQGINHLDTADLYDFGENEKLIGDVIKHKRSELVLTTKVGNHFDKKKKSWFWDPSKEYILEAVKNSLRRLQTDYIDFYMLHGGTIEDQMDETIEAFEQLKKEGLIRAYGISSIRPNVIREYVKHASIDGVMLQYNLFDRRPEEEILDLLHANSISVLARGPLAKGMLSNKAEKQMKIKGKDGYLDYTYGELQSIHQQLTANLHEASTLNELALKYVLKHPAVATAVFGASSIEQVEENINFDLSKALTNETYFALQKLAKSINYTQHR